MQKAISFFWFCSGAETEILKKCPTEASKYTGIGATIFFTGVFAFLSASYALYTVFDSVWAAIGFGIIWGLMIFNLDRFIVSSMRKEGRVGREFLMATPRLILAILISVICHTCSTTSHLDRNHTVFGKVVEGQEVIDQIRAGDVMERVVVKDEA